MPNYNNDHSFANKKERNPPSNIKEHEKEKEKRENFVIVIQNEKNRHHESKTIMMVCSFGMRNTIDVILHKEHVDHA